MVILSANQNAQSIESSEFARLTTKENFRIEQKLSKHFKAIMLKQFARAGFSHDRSLHLRNLIVCEGGILSAVESCFDLAVVPFRCRFQFDLEGSALLLQLI